MKKKHAVYLVLLWVLLGLSLLAGCDSVLTPEPIGQTVVDDVYSDVAGAISGVTAAYEPLASSGAYNGSFYQMSDLASDDVFWVQQGASSVNLANTFEVTPERGPMGGLWNSHFEGIARSNTVLARVPAMEFPSDQADLKASILGQAHFLRALYYFNLVRFFGDVPLFTTELESPQEAAVPRTPVEEVYAQIEQDLTQAAEQLPVKSEMGDSRGWELGRATSGAALTLLAKVYLTLEDWNGAAQATQEVIDSGEYELFSNYAANFQGRNENGVESIFEIQYSAGRDGTGAIHNFRMGPSEIVGGGGAGLRIAPTNDTLNATGRPGANGNGIVQAFEPDGRRQDAALSNYGLDSYYRPGTGEPMMPLINKYFAGPDPDHNTNVNYPVLRYAEVLLIRAEALNEMNQKEEAAAHLNQVRSRVGLDPLPGVIVSDQEALREAIWHERRVELCFESKRYFDLNRTGRLKEVMALQEITVDPAHIVEHPMTGKSTFLYPIPRSEIDNNPAITQNPGY